MGRGGDPLKLGAHQPAIGMVESPPAAKRRDEARGRLRIDPVHAQDHVREEAVTLSSRGMERPLIGGEPAHQRAQPIGIFRSEEHTYELQSLMRISYAVF